MNQAPTEAQPLNSDEVLNSNMQYWYDFLFWGVMRGEDKMLMLTRVEIEQKIFLMSSELESAANGKTAGPTMTKEPFGQLYSQVLYAIVSNRPG